MEAWCEEFWLRPARRLHEKGVPKQVASISGGGEHEGGGFRPSQHRERPGMHGLRIFILALSFNNTRGQAAGGKRGVVGQVFSLSPIVDLLVFLSPHVTSKKKCTPPQPQGSVTAQIPLEEVFRYHYGIKFPSSSVLPEGSAAGLTAAHTHSHHHNTTHYRGISAR